MKKLFSMLLAAAMLLALSACGTKNAGGSSASEPKNTVSDDAVQTAPNETDDRIETETSDGTAEELPQETFGETIADTVTPASGQTPEQTPTPEPTTTPDTDGKVLVAYFSATGNTAKIARHLETILDADLYEIVPEQPYTAADLDYNSDCRANQEQNDDSARPAISDSISNMDDYDVVFVGYPIWWGREPKIIDTFLESYDFSGKTIIPFCTSGSSGISGSVSSIQTLASNANWLSGQRFSGSDGLSAVESWVSGLPLGR